jgi:hypothetical protein
MKKGEAIIALIEMHHAPFMQDHLGCGVHNYFTFK